MCLVRITCAGMGLDAGVDEIEAVRQGVAISYGSCSFTEPIEEAKANGWL